MDDTKKTSRRQWQGVNMSPELATWTRSLDDDMFPPGIYRYSSRVQYMMDRLRSLPLDKLKTLLRPTSDI